MLEGRFSRTAFGVAIRRAAHQVLDQPRVLEDPLALAIIGSEAAQKLQSDPRHHSPFSRGLRAWVSVRSRYADDQLANAVEHGVNQYVVLGAGLDTSAYRNRHEGLRVFEVDHPATQAWKRQRLREAGIAIPPSLNFVAVDFESQTLADGLRLAGFSADQPTFFSWLGVTPYINCESCIGTFAFIAKLPSGSGVVFDFAIDPSQLDFLHRMAFKALAARVAMAGEPFQLFFVPEELERDLKALGFRQVEMLSSAEINALYFKDRADGLKIGGNLGRLACARL
jgi:methyltransferase (TIGR00027 family)